MTWNSEYVKSDMRTHSVLGVNVSCLRVACHWNNIYYCIHDCKTIPCINWDSFVYVLAVTVISQISCCMVRM